MLNLLHSSTNQELFEKYLCNHYEKYRRFPLHKGSHHVQLPNQHFLLSAKMNGTQVKQWLVPKECIGHTAVRQKALLWLKRYQTVEKFKPVALAVIELR